MGDEEAANELKAINSSNTILRLPRKDQRLLQTLSSSTISIYAIFLYSYAPYYSTMYGNYHLIPFNPWVF